MIHFNRISLISSLLVLLIIVMLSSTCSSTNESSSDSKTSEISEKELVKYHKCKSFIQKGVKYVFTQANHWHKTIPSTVTSYNYGEVLFEGNNMFLAFGNIHESYRVIGALYEEVEAEYSKKEGGSCDFHRAQLKLESDGLYYYALLELGPNHNFQISSALSSAPKLNYFPKESFIPALHDIRYSMFYCNRR